MKLASGAPFHRCLSPGCAREEAAGICFLGGALEDAVEGIGEGEKGGCMPHEFGDSSFRTTAINLTFWATENAVR